MLVTVCINVCPGLRKIKLISAFYVYNIGVAMTCKVQIFCKYTIQLVA